MSSKFELLLQQPILPETEALLLPDRPMARRLCNNLKELLGDGNDSYIKMGDYDMTILTLSKLLTPLALEIIEKPISFNEYLERRTQAFLGLINLWNNYYKIRFGGENDSETDDYSYDFTHIMRSAVLASTGILSRDEVFRSRGIEWNGFQDNEIETDVGELNLESISSNKSVVTYEEAKEAIQMSTEEGLITALYIGVFDLDHEGHKYTAYRAKQVLGPQSILLCGVVDDRQSIVQKGKIPIRGLDRRIKNMSAITGLDSVFPIVLPDDIQTIEEASLHFSNLQSELAPHIRIVGNLNSIEPGLWEIYKRVCKQSDILLIYNDEFIDVSTSQEISRISQAVI